MFLVTVIQNLEFRLDYLQAAAGSVFIYFAVERDDLPGLELVAEVGSVKPYAF